MSRDARGLDNRGLDGRVVVITGAGRGIGREYARAVAAEGAAVVIAELDADAAEETARLVRDGGGTALAIATEDRISTLLVSRDGRILWRADVWRTELRAGA